MPCQYLHLPVRQPVQAKEWYRQDLVGAAIAASGIPRNQLFVTSKLHPQTHGYWSTLQVGRGLGAGPAAGGQARAGRRGERPARWWLRPRVAGRGGGRERLGERRKGWKMGVFWELPSPALRKAYAELP